MNQLFAEKIKFKLPPWLFIFGGVITLSLFTGMVAGKGKIAYVIPILALLIIPFLTRVGVKIRFGVLFVSPFLILFQTPSIHIPFGIPLIALFLFGLAIAELLYPIYHQSQHNRDREFISIIPLGVFAIGGLITALKSGGGEINNWYITSLVILLLFFTVRRLVLTPSQVNLILVTAFLAILIYLFLVLLANFTGRVLSLSLNNQYWRLIGLGQTIQIGLIEYRNQWSVTIGTFAGLGFPLGVAFLVQKNKHILLRIIALPSLVALIYIIGSTAARGAAIAALASGIVVILMVIRDRPISALIITISVAVFLLFYQNIIISLFPSNALQRFLELNSNLTGVDTFRYRLDILNLTIQNIIKQPLGYGYGYLWNRYRLDESILYSAILNGAGIVGAIGYLLVMLQFAWKYFITIFNSRNPSFQYRELAAIGSGVWVYGVLAGFSSQSLLLDPVHSYIFWTIIIATYNGIKRNAINAT